MNDDALAEWLQPQLKRSGPAPNTMHIKAAIMVARDGVGARAACRAVPGLSETVNGSVGKLAQRVRALLQHDAPHFPPPTSPAQQQQPRLPQPPQPQPPSMPVSEAQVQHMVNELQMADLGVDIVGAGTDVDGLMESLGLPPLCGHHDHMWLPDAPMPDVPAPVSDEPLPSPDEMSRCDVRNYHV